MDQLKSALAWLKAQHFWVLTLLVVAIALTSWYLAKSKLTEEFDANQQAIDSEFTSVRNLQNKPLHPNDDVNARQAEEIQDLAAKVRELWEQLYDRQREEALVWPEELSRGFRNYVRDLSFGDTIISDYRQEYLDYIEDTFSTLPAIIDAREIEDSAARAGMSRGRGGGEGMDGFYGAGRRGYGATDSDEMFDDGHMVRWHDQLAVKQQLTWNEVPSSVQIWVTQEDLWVYRTLLRAIAATNRAAGADRYSNAAVRDIYALEVGQPAAQATSTGSRIFMPADESSLSGPGMRGEFGMSRGDMAGASRGAGGDTQSPYSMELGGRGGMGRPGMEEGGDPNAALLAYRYVDAAGEPLAAPTEGEFKFGTEFKRLPVRLVLTLDQRWLPRLIVELANQPLQVEVEEVRIDPAGGVESSGVGPRGMSSGSGSRSMGGRSMGGALGGDGEVQAFDRQPQVRQQVVLKGVVYILYPPDESVLRVEGAAAQAGLASDF